jgi:hypothetical protein
MLGAFDHRFMQHLSVGWLPDPHTTKSPSSTTFGSRSTTHTHWHDPSVSARSPLFHKPTVGTPTGAGRWEARQRTREWCWPDTS